MKLEHIVALAVRLFAIAVAIYALRTGISLVPYFYEQEWVGASYTYAGLMLTLLLVSVGLWMFPLTIARGLVAFREPGEVDVKSASADQIQTIAYSVLGLYLLYHVLSDIVYWGFTLFITLRNSAIPIELSIEQIGLMIATVVELLFVLFLLLGARGMVTLLRRFRYGEDA